MVRSYLEDTMSQTAKRDSLIQVLTDETSLHLNYLLTFLYFETGQYSEGEYHLDSIPFQVILSVPEQSEHNALEDYYSLLTDMVEDSTAIMFPDSLQVEELFDIYDSGTGRAFVYVRSILHSNNEIVYEEPIILPDPYKTAEMFNFTDPSLTGNRDNSMLKIYPNPARDFIIAEYRLGEKYGKAEISIKTIDGKSVKDILLLKEQDQKIINLKDYIQGIYIATLLIDGKNNGSVKFTIAR